MSGLTEKLRPHVADIKAAIASGDRKAEEVRNLYNMHCDCPSDPGAYGLCHAALDDWLKSREAAPMPNPATDTLITELDARRIAKRLGLKPLHVLESSFGKPDPSEFDRQLGFAAGLAIAISGPAPYERDCLAEMTGGRE